MLTFQSLKCTGKAGARYSYVRDQELYKGSYLKENPRMTTYRIQVLMSQALQKNILHRRVGNFQDQQKGSCLTLLIYIYISCDASSTFLN